MNMTAGKKNWRLMNNLMSLIFEKMSLDDAKKKIRDMSTEEKNAFFLKKLKNLILKVRPPDKNYMV